MRSRLSRLAAAHTAAGCAAAGLGWAAGRPDPAGALAHVTAGPADDGVVALAALLAWALLAWVLVVLAASTCTLVPGVAGRIAAATARVVTPVAARRLLEVGLGVTLATGALGALPAVADSAPPRPPAATAAPSLDWPRPASEGVVAPEPQARPAPVQPAIGLVAAQPRPAAAAQAEVVVRRGDTLWDIAARHLGPGASAADIAAAWPRWFATNRTVIGTDPDLIVPGQRLVPPAPAR